MILFIYPVIIFYLLGTACVVLYHLKGYIRAGSLSKGFLAAGFVVHSAGLLLRIYSTGHAPMASIYETLVFYSWAVVLTSLVVITRYGERTTELVTVPLAVLALLFAVSFQSPGGPLPLILRTRWFEIHVTFSFAAYALFTLAFSAALTYVFIEGRGASTQRLRTYEDIAARSVLWGFLFFSVSMFAGAVWGWLAWGAYWLWEPKIIWSFIVWFYYAGAMHTYYISEWKGRYLAFATIGGFFVVLFTYLGVGLLMKSSHSF